MTTLKEKLETGIALQGPKALDTSLATSLIVGDCRKILKLLAAAKRFHEDHDSDLFDIKWAARDDLLNAIYAMEA